MKTKIALSTIFLGMFITGNALAEKEGGAYNGPTFETISIPSVVGQGILTSKLNEAQVQCAGGFDGYQSPFKELFLSVFDKTTSLDKVTVTSFHNHKSSKTEVTISAKTEVAGWKVCSMNVVFFPKSIQIDFETHGKWRDCSTIKLPRRFRLGYPSKTYKFSGDMFDYTIIPLQEKVGIESNKEILTKYDTLGNEILSEFLTNIKINMPKNYTEQVQLINIGSIKIKDELLPPYGKTVGSLSLTPDDIKSQGVTKFNFSLNDYVNCLQAKILDNLEDRSDYME